MTYQITSRHALTPYRVEGEGPMGFAVMNGNAVLGDHQSKEAAAEKAGEIARQTIWAALFDVVRHAGIDHSTLLRRLAHRNEPTEDLFLLIPDYNSDAVGGCLLVGDIWHRGHVLDSIGVCKEIYMPYRRALEFLDEKTG
ncbi:MAG: hypothetical protein A3H71_03000 [Candidatus Sungbacteria bacterium RIFCSPLOWO2_02_FULL_48_13b]|uniref:Uncharacterized protein n=1 Tax=Candidatus Sungbacteria bacterium RIFCSPLOWO2_02_FULL_48_13b TaxID=1802283 RepID=A0A1G2LLA8_9BACT|nr:MAG: hypothetical protein A3H71_03000 [Candidatus Sungbacteria bacterium RIFCSPLOWO2_02_FULL_48_13b]